MVGTLSAVTSQSGRLAILTRALRCPRATLIAVIGTLLVAACGGSNAPPQYTVGGSVSGLSGSGLVLQVNGGDDLAIATNGSFVFSAALASGLAYSVTLKTEPTNPSQTCVVSAGNGTIRGAKVSNVVVT